MILIAPIIWLRDATGPYADRMRAAVLSAAALIADALLDHAAAGRIHGEGAGVMIGTPLWAGQTDQLG